jgi:uncharacterized protein YoxC
MDSNTINLIISITEIVLFITLIITAIFLIISMKKFLKFFSNIEREVIEMTDKLNPVITDMKEITDDIKIMVDKSRIQLDKVQILSDSLIEKGSGLVDTINKIQNTGNAILSNTVNIFTSVSKGYKIFREKLNNSF